MTSRPMLTDDEILAKTFLIEGDGGEYTDHPDDSGGPTRWGVTIPVLSAYRGRPCSARDIQMLTREEAAECYKRIFIRPFDGIDERVRHNVLDMGIHAGRLGATRLFQQIIGTTVDGKIGPVTRRISSMRDWNALYCGGRLGYYEDLVLAYPKNMRWRNGWRNRALSFVDPMIFVRRARVTAVGKPIFGYMGKAAA